MKNRDTFILEMMLSMGAELEWFELHYLFATEVQDRLNTLTLGRYKRLPRKSHVRFVEEYPRRFFATSRSRVGPPFVGLRERRSLLCTGTMRSSARSNPRQASSQ